MPPTLIRMLLLLWTLNTALDGLYICPTVTLDCTEEDLQCVALSQKDSLPGYDGTVAAGSLRSAAVLGRCSVLHLQQCAQREWGQLGWCIRHIVAAVAAADSTQLSSWADAAAHLAANSTAAARCAYATVLAQGAACGAGAGGSDVCWVLSVATTNAGFDGTTCAQSLGKDRCARATYRAAVFQWRAARGAAAQACSPGQPDKPQGDLVTAFDIGSGGLCGGDRYAAGDDGTRCLAVHHHVCQEVEGGGAGFCLRWAEHLS
jgi:hypothetical protein